MKARTILIAIAALLGLLVLAIVVFVATFDPNRYKPELVELVRERTGRTLHIEGDLSLSLWPRLALASGPARLSDTDGSGEAARVESAEVEVALRPLLSRRLVIEGIRAEGLRAALAAGAAQAAGPRAQADGATPVPNAGPGAETPAAAPTAHPWRLERATLVASRIASGEPGTLELDGQLVSPAGEQAFALALRSGYRADFAQRHLALKGLDARLTGSAGAAVGLQARMRADIDADLEARSAVANPLAIEAAQEAGPKLNLTGSGTLDASAGTAALALQGTLDETNLQLNANAETLSPPALRYTLAADQLDVDALRARVQGASPSGPASAPAEAPAGGGSAAPPPPAAQPASQHPLASIAGIDTQGTIRVERLRASGLTITDLAAGAKTGDGRVAVDPLTGTVNEGELRASAMIEGSAYHVQASLKDVDAGALLRDAADREILRGRGAVALDLRTSGETARALTSGLAGTASFDLRQGAIEGVDLEAILRAVRAALERQVPVDLQARADGRTGFDSLAGRFDLAGGVARSENVEFRADWAQASATGRIDLNARSLDWLVRATATPGKAAGSDPARDDLLARLEGVTVPIRITGPFDDLAYRVEVGDLVGHAARRELERRLERKLGERLGLPSAPSQEGQSGDEANPLDRLRGLLRR